MTRSARRLLLLLIVLPFVPFAGSVGGSTLACGNNPTSFTVGSAIFLSGTIANDPDHTYGQLTYPDLSTGAALTAMLGMDGINGTWRYNLGSLMDTGSYTLTVFADNSDSTPCACGFSLTAASKNSEKKQKTEHAGQAAATVGGTHQEGTATTGGPKGNLIRITEVRAFALDGQQYVQVRGNVASQAANMALQAHMTADITTDAGTTKVRFFAKQVFRCAVPQSNSTDVYAEFNVTQFPRGIYDVRLSSLNPNAIKTRKNAVILGPTVCPTYHH